MNTVPRIGRVLDLVGLALFLAGAGTYGWAWVGLSKMPDLVPDPTAEPFAALRLFDGYLRVRLFGGLLMLAGVMVFVTAWWVARRTPSGLGPPRS